jgi:hypothetical protein
MHAGDDPPVEQGVASTDRPRRRRAIDFAGDVGKTAEDGAHDAGEVLAGRGRDQ